MSSDLPELGGMTKNVYHSIFQNNASITVFDSIVFIHAFFMCQDMFVAELVKQVACVASCSYDLSMTTLADNGCLISISFLEARVLPHRALFSV